jgi:Rrf2 family protein
MRLTTKSSYGVRALINLAVMHGKKQPVSISSISKEEGISTIYLEQIFNVLKNHGLVKSVRGPKGGYVLAKDPAKVNVYEAIKILEGDISSVRCIPKLGKGKTCARLCNCASKEVWEELTRQIEKTLKGFSLKYLADRAIKINPERLVGAR